MATGYQRGKNPASHGSRTKIGNVEVPMKTCPNCKGSGRFKEGSMGGSECSRCGGVGKVVSTSRSDYK